MVEEKPFDPINADPVDAERWRKATQKPPEFNEPPKGRISLQESMERAFWDKVERYGFEK
jgi:hypothetical protein